MTLLEEPQAAFYAWIDSTTSGTDWRKQVKVGELVLISDVGGGTTDLTLISVGDDNGQMVLTRVAVGDHGHDRAGADRLALQAGDRRCEPDKRQIGVAEKEALADVLLGRAEPGGEQIQYAAWPAA